MPTVKLNKKTVMKLLGKQLDDKTLKDRISMLGTDLEDVNSEDIDVEIFPNRPDMLSEQGFARALSSFIGVKTGLRKYSVAKSQYEVYVDKNVSNVRPYTLCAVVKDLKFTDENIREVIQIQEKLHVTFCRNRKKAAIGIYPMEKISFPIKYLAKKPSEILFKPLEALKEMDGAEILSRHPAGKTYAHLMKGLKKYALFVDNYDKILSMPPIINSHETGKVSENTKDIFIEASGFDFHTLNMIINILSTMFSDMGGKLYEVKVKYSNKIISSPNLNPAKMKIDIQYVNKLLGLELKEKDLEKLFAKMGYDYSKGTAQIPSYRADILHPIDLVEDVAIAYGYENFKEEIPDVATIGSESEMETFKRKISEILTGLGLLETSSYHLTNKETQCEKMLVNLPLIELDSAVNEEYNVLRTWMLPQLIKILSENRHHELPQKIFEAGVMFTEDAKSETGVKEFTRLGVAITHQTANFTEAKQILDYLLRMLDVKYNVRDVKHDSFIKGRVGRVSVQGKDVAYIGEIHPQVLNNFDIKTPIVGFELNLTELFEILNK
ncbi:MAG: phenylalanine--tRNA ligase subunit beta [archaeon]